MRWRRLKNPFFLPYDRVINHYFVPSLRYMWRKIRSLWICLLFCLSIFYVVDLTFDVVERASGGNVLYVNTTGDGGAYTSIQDALDAASDGDTIYVYKGKYFDNIVINKVINLTGEDRQWSSIHGRIYDFTIKIVVDWVNITNMNITASGPHHDGIGIVVDNVKNCRIMNNNITYEKWGMKILKSSNIYITSNYFFTPQTYGIYLSGSNNINISYNIIRDCNFGIYSDSSSHNDMYYNNMSNNGILIKGDLLDHWNTHNIDTSNIVNEKPVYYWRNQSEGIIPQGGGQVIIANCTDIDVSSQDLNNTSVGIEFGFCLNCNITSINSSNNEYGAFIYNSDKSTIVDSFFSKNNYSIYIYSSNNNSILRNYVFSTGRSAFGSGIYLYDFSSPNNIRDNILYDNYHSIRIDSSDLNNITGNSICDSYRGIFIEDSNNNNISNNIMTNNSYGSYLTNSHNNMFIGNDLSLNWYAVYLAGSDNIITNNIFSSNNYYSLYLSWSNRNNITKNNITDSNGYGITLYWSDSNNITWNRVLNNNGAIYINGSVDNYVAKNTISNNIY